MPAILLPVPHRQQNDDGDCLAACALMVLEYLGIPVAYERLLNLLKVQWFGAPFSNLRFLEGFVTVVIEKKGTLHGLRELLSNHYAPIVAVDAGELPYSDRSTSHVVVVVGMDEYYVYLNDPALTTESVPVPWGDFDLAWLEKDRQYAVLSLQR